MMMTDDHHHHDDDNSRFQHQPFDYAKLRFITNFYCSKIINSSRVIPINNSNKPLNRELIELLFKTTLPNSIFTLRTSVQK